MKYTFLLRGIQDHLSLVLFVLIIIIPFFSGCNNAVVGPVDSGDIWPLKSGNIWFYKIDQPTWNQDTLKTEITGSLVVAFKGENYTTLKVAFYSISQPLPDYQWLYWKGSDGIYLMGGVSPTDTFIVKELELKYPASIGDTWIYHSVAYSLDRKQFYISDTLTYSLVATDIPVGTPDGTFECYQYRFIKHPEPDVYALWDYNFYYAPGIGNISEESISQVDGTTKEKNALIKYQIQ